MGKMPEAQNFLIPPRTTEEPQQRYALERSVSNAYFSNPPLFRREVEMKMTITSSKNVLTDLNPITLRKAKIVCNVGLSECNNVKIFKLRYQLFDIVWHRYTWTVGFVG